MYNDIQRMHLTMYCFKPRLKLINLEHNKKIGSHLSDGWAGEGVKNGLKVQISFGKLETHSECTLRITFFIVMATLVNLKNLGPP